MKNVVALQNNLISLTDKVFPGVNEMFSSPDRADGSQKWVDFIMTFWHCECIALISEAAFMERYRKLCFQQHIKQMGELSQVNLAYLIVKAHKALLSL